MAFRILYAIAADHELDMERLDAKAAFLYGLVQELSYAHMPPGFKIPRLHISSSRQSMDSSSYFVSGTKGCLDSFSKIKAHQTAHGSCDLFH